MSFSQDVKEELKTIALEKEHCLRALIAGIMYDGGRESVPEQLRGYVQELEKQRTDEREISRNDPELLQRPCCKKAFLRGLFLSAGSISNPEKIYHLEIVCETYDDALFVREMLKNYELKAKTVERKGRFVVYLKEGDQIVDFLAVLQASRSLLNLENVRVLKDVRNNVNRQTNCETANITKTVSAALSQIQAIEYLQQNGGLSSLPYHLREIAQLRISYPEASLTELGEMLDPPVGKSGVNHRLRKIREIAEEAQL